MTNREAFVTSLAVLGATFDRKLSAPAIEGYWLALSELGEEDFKVAVTRAVSECRFMPSPSELLAFVRPRQDPAAAAIKAWQAVRSAIDRYDYLVGSIDFGPLVNAVIRNLGGWDTMCRATLPELDNPGWLRKRFEEIYRSLATTDAQTLHGAPLEGKLPPRYDNPLHLVVPLDGGPVIPRLEANGVKDARGNLSALVRELADAKDPDAR